MEIFWEIIPITSNSRGRYQSGFIGYEKIQRLLNANANNSAAAKLLSMQAARGAARIVETQRHWRAHVLRNNQRLFFLVVERDKPD